MNLSSIFIITTLITGTGEVSKNAKGFDEMSVIFKDIKSETLVDKEEVSSMEQCEEIIFARGLKDIFEPIPGESSQWKVVVGLKGTVYLTNNNFDTANFKERNFEEPKTKDKHNKTMNVMFKNKVSIDYADYRGVFNRKKVMECVEVKK